MKIKRVILILMAAVAFTLSAEEIDENAMFSDVVSVEEESAKIVNSSIAEEEKKSTSLSGELWTYSTYSADYNSIEGKSGGASSFDNYMSANLLLDIRLKNNIKGFGNVQIDYYPQGQKETQTFRVLGADIALENEVTAKYALKELFIDANINKKIYLRAGKQVLQWGRGYLWNPTDMINVEKKKFKSDSNYREGAFGIKGHIPFGTSLNIYTFINMTDAEKSDEMAAAGKVEFLVGSTEMALSAWTKKNARGVIGADVSSRIGKFDIWSEASFSDGDNNLKMKIVDERFETYREDRIIPKASIGAGRGFDIGEEKERIRVTGELFYNGAGYDENYFADKKKRLTTLTGGVLKTDIDGYIVGEEESVEKELNAAEYMVFKGLYSPNEMSKYYGALFLTFNKFIISDMTLNMNIISNLVDGSYMVNPYAAYKDINDLSVKFGITGYGGNKNGEYRISGRGIDTTMSAGISF